jgi:CRISPR-associated protein Cmr1
MPDVLTARFRVLTPLFLGGADPDTPEIRAASIKAALRFWYRAVDPAALYAERKGEPRLEDRLFGGAGDGAGQSPVLVRLTFDERLPKFDWGKVNLGQFNEGRGTYARNGLKYLSYPFHMRGNEDRRALDAGTEFDLRFVVPRRRKRADIKISDKAVRQAWLASIWLLGSVGSLGTRSRRGFGSLEITNWASLSGTSEWSEEAARLPDLCHSKDAEDWRTALLHGKTVISEWFEAFQNYEPHQFGHPHFGADATWQLLGGYREWTVAINAAGRRLQDFRVRRQPDNENVKRALQTGRPLRQTPERAAFGLPLTFRYGDLGEAQFVPWDPEKTRDRHASLLRIRLARIGDRLHPLFLRLSGAVPGRDPKADLMRVGRGRRERENLEPTSGELLDQFMSELAKG